MIYSQKELVVIFLIFNYGDHTKHLSHTSSSLLLKAVGTLDVFVVIAHTNCDATMTPYYTVIP